MQKHDKTKILKRAMPKLNRRTGVFLACVVLAALFWLLTALSKDFVEIVQIPIVYKDVPENVLIVNELTPAIDAEVKIFGFDLLWYWLKFEKFEIPITADPDELRAIKRGGEQWHVYLTSEQKNNIAAHFDEEFQLLRISPDSLFFQFKPLFQKRVPVQLDAEIGYDKQYGLIGEPMLSPDSVIISGPKDLVDTIAYVSTRSQVFNGLTESVTATLELNLPENELISISENQVGLELNVAEFTEGKLSIPVEVMGADAANVKIYPSTVDITYAVPLSNYDAVREEQFHVFVDLSDDGWKSLPRLTVEVGSYPEGIRQIRVHPPQVEYIIQGQ